MNYIWRRKLCYYHQALDVLNYEHVILYIHMYEPYSCAIKFMLFIIHQLLIIAYIIIYIPVQTICGRFDLSGPKQLNRRFNLFETVGSVNQWTDGLTGSISNPVLITMHVTLIRGGMVSGSTLRTQWRCHSCHSPEEGRRGGKASHGVLSVGKTSWRLSRRSFRSLCNMASMGCGSSTPSSAVGLPH